MLIKEMEIYALGSLVDSGWMHLDGWHYRALKRGNARTRIHREAREWRALRGKAAPHIGIAVDSTLGGAASSCNELPSERCHITP